MYRDKSNIYLKGDTNMEFKTNTFKVRFFMEDLTIIEYSIEANNSLSAVKKACNKLSDFNRDYNYQIKKIEVGEV